MHSRCRAGFVGLTLCVSVVGHAATYKFAIIDRGSTSPFGKLIREGAAAARDELAVQGVVVELIGEDPKKPQDRAEQARLVDQAIVDGANGILFAPIDRKEGIAPVESAAKHGVPVVLLDSGADTSAVSSLIATDNREAGRMAARELARLLDGKGNVLLLRYQIHAANTEEREEGFLEVIETQFPQIHVVASDFHAGPTRESAKRVSGVLLHMHDKSLNGVFASSETGTAGMLDGLRAAGIAPGTVKVIGVDEKGDILPAAMKAGELQGYVAQDPVQMGHQAVRSLVAAIQHERVEPIENTRLSLVTPSGETAPPATERLGAATTLEAKPQAAFPVAAQSAAANVVGDFTIPEIALTMTAIAPGELRMAPRESDTRAEGGPQMNVTLHAYWIGRYEVTQAQWLALMGSNPSDFNDTTRPVENVSWEDAMTFCRKLTDRERAAGRLPAGYQYTLPTEAQWEYACRAGTSKPYYGEPDKIGWFATNSGAVDRQSGVWRMSTHPVGEKQPNAWGLYDMCGNVSEWCLDWYGEFPGGAQIDPTGPARGVHRVLRGGCWWADVQNCRSDSRHRGPPTRRHSALGLRVALSAVAAPTTRP